MGLTRLIFQGLFVKVTENIGDQNPQG